MVEKSNYKLWHILTAFLVGVLLTAGAVLGPQYGQGLSKRGVALPSYQPSPENKSIGIVRESIPSRSLGVQLDESPAKSGTVDTETITNVYLPEITRTISRMNQIQNSSIIIAIENEGIHKTIASTKAKLSAINNTTLQSLDGPAQITLSQALGHVDLVNDLISGKKDFTQFGVFTQAEEEIVIIFILHNIEAKLNSIPALTKA